MLTGFRGAVVLGIVVGMPMTSYFLVFKPQNQNIVREREDVTYKRSVLDKVREANAKNEDLAKTNENLQASIKAIVARLPSGKEIDDVVRQVSDEAIKAGLQPPAMRSGKPLQASLYMEQPLEMEINGDLEGFRSFITSIEKLPRLTRIPDLKLTATQKEDLELKAEFTMSIYFQEGNATEIKP